MTEVSTSTDGTAPDCSEPQALNAVPEIFQSEPAPNTLLKVGSHAAVDWDHLGRVVSSKFSCGHVCQFRYDSGGNLYAFTYGKLAWSTLDGVHWAARDQNYDWTMTGKVLVGLDGTIRIERQHIARSLKLSGKVIDEYPDGTSIESVRPTAEITAGDLLAISHPRVVPTEPAAVVRQPSEMPAEAGALPTSKAADEGSAERRGLAGGLRLNRLREADDQKVRNGKLVDDAKSAVDDFVTNAAIRLVEMTKGVEALELAPLLDKQAIACHKERRVDEARICHERALEIRRAHQGPDHADTGINLHGLGRIYLDWGRYNEAEQCLLDAVKVFEKGLRKSRFLHSTNAISSASLSGRLHYLINGLNTLACLYHEQRKLHLCNQLYESAVVACNSVDQQHRDGLKTVLESLQGMAAHAELESQSAVKTNVTPARLRATFN